MVCTLIEKDGKPNYCEKHGYHEGHYALYAVDPGEKGERFRKYWDSLLNQQPKKLLRSLPLAKTCQHNTGANGTAKAGCATCTTYGCAVKGTVRVSDCVYCTEWNARQDQRTTTSTYLENSKPTTEISSHENRAGGAEISWLPVNGEWVKDPNVWPVFRDMIQQEIATLE